MLVGGTTGFIRPPGLQFFALNAEFVTRKREVKRKKFVKFKHEAQNHKKLFKIYMAKN